MPEDQPVAPPADPPEEPPAAKTADGTREQTKMIAAINVIFCFSIVIFTLPSKAADFVSDIICNTMLDTALFRHVMVRVRLRVA